MPKKETPCFNQSENIMSAILTASINLDKIPKDAIIEGKKGRYVNVTVIANDELDNYGNQVAVTLSQTKEQREAKEGKTYLGNGKVAWVGGEGVTKLVAETDDLPF